MMDAHIRKPAHQEPRRAKQRGTGPTFGGARMSFCWNSLDTVVTLKGIECLS